MPDRKTGANHEDRRLLPRRRMKLTRVWTPAEAHRSSESGKTIARSRKPLNFNGIGLIDQTVQIPHFKIGKGKRLFPMGHDPAQSATHEIKPPANRLHEIGIEAVKPDKFLFLEFRGTIDLLSLIHI